MNPRFSIIVPAYNVAEFIDESIQSVLNQKFTNYEIIVVDDCSTDGTKDKIEKYEDKRISKYTTNKNTKTAGGPRNIALDQAVRRLYYISR